MDYKKMEIKELLEKYPFLEYHNVFNNELTEKTEKDKLKYNWWTAWDNYGWENIWKKYLSVLFEEYNKMSDELKKDFRIIDTKEKYGTLRVDISNGTDKILEAENILYMLSQWTCCKCGKMPRNSKGERIIWETKGYICPYCKDCVKKELKNNHTLKYTNWKIKELKFKNNGFISNYFCKEGKFKYVYEDLGDWLKLNDIVKVEIKNERNDN